MRVTKKLGGTYINIIKVTYDKPIANIIISERKTLKFHKN